MSGHSGGEVLLVPDCGVGAGLGHLERTLALADVLAASVSCRVAVPHGNLQVRDRVAARGHTPVEAFGGVAQRALALCDALRPDAVVLDAYGVGAEHQRGLRRLTCLVVVDDLAADCDCDLAVNPSAGGEALRPQGATDFLGGAAYAPLSSAYSEARKTRDAPGAVDARTVLLSTGATSLGGLGARVAETLLADDASLHVLAVAGPDAGAQAPRTGDRLDVLAAPPTLAPAMRRATVYAGAAGTTALQAASVGVPMVVVAAVDNQAAQAAVLAEAGCALRVDAEEMAATVVRLLDDAPLRGEMARRGRSLVDGRGAERVAEAVIALAARGRARA